MPTTSTIRKVITTDTSCYKAEGILILARLSHSWRSVLTSAWLYNPLFSFIFCYTRSWRTCDYVRLRTYLPTGIFLRKTRLNKKCTYKEIDTDYHKQTASTIPTFSGVKAYVTQSNMLHFWVILENRSYHLACGTYLWDMCKIWPITKVHYPWEFFKKQPWNDI